MGRGPAESGAAGVTFQTSDFDTGVSFWHISELTPCQHGVPNHNKADIDEPVLADLMSKRA